MSHGPDSESVSHMSQENHAELISSAFCGNSVMPQRSNHESLINKSRKGRIQSAKLPSIGLRRLAFFPAASSPGYYYVINRQYSVFQESNSNFEAIGLPM